MARSTATRSAGSIQRAVGTPVTRLRSWMRRSKATSSPSATVCGAVGGTSGLTRSGPRPERFWRDSLAHSRTCWRSSLLREASTSIPRTVSRTWRNWSGSNRSGWCHSHPPATRHLSVSSPRCWWSISATTPALPGASGCGRISHRDRSAPHHRRWPAIPRRVVKRTMRNSYAWCGSSSASGCTRRGTRGRSARRSARQAILYARCCCPGIQTRWSSSRLRRRWSTSPSLRRSALSGRSSGPKRRSLFDAILTPLSRCSRRQRPTAQRIRERCSPAEPVSK